MSVHVISPPTIRPSVRLETTAMVTSRPRNPSTENRHVVDKLLRGRDSTRHVPAAARWVRDIVLARRGGIESGWTCPDRCGILPVQEFKRAKDLATANEMTRTKGQRLPRPSHPPVRRARVVAFGYTYWGVGSMAAMSFRCGVACTPNG